MITRTRSGKSSHDFNYPPFWTLQFWHGMRSSIWWQLLIRNRFQLSLKSLPAAVSISVLTPLNDILYAIQQLCFGKQIAETQPVAPPLFVIGHYRSGTTLLHELLAADKRFASPSFYQCFTPWHFLVSEWMMIRFGGFLIPDKRPMDNMRVSLTLPAEDEFALMNMGCVSPYEHFAFPMHRLNKPNSADIDRLDEEQLAHWEASFYWFIQALTVRFGKQLVMKSPPHTGRIGVLHKMFPQSRFIHITRDPRKLFPSTVRMWQAMDTIYSLQRTPSKEQYEEFVFDNLTRMYASFEKQRLLLPPKSIIELRYEDLVVNPIEQMRTIYQKLDLDGFEKVIPALSQRLDSDRAYRINKYSISPEQEKRILNRWRDYALRYGYL